VRAHAENRKPFVMAMVDLDDFKDINDVHGHQVGDRALLAAVQRLGSCVRTTDFLARYGGDEAELLEPLAVYRAFANGMLT
jgi:diguanylate cyclase (GGDEF)-like protein